MTGGRLPAGGLINRSRPLAFSFDGRAHAGFSGDTLASALLANGVEVVGRSFKYHRPRGLLAAGVEEPNALVQLGRGAAIEVSPPATTVELYDGLEARAVNAWPSARFDVGGVNDRLSRFIPAGFYYKTFMRPGWKAYEWAIRRAAGLGRPSSEPDPDRYDSRWAHCDVLVVGAGPAGLTAARAAAASGARVMLVEQDTRLGGALLHTPAEIDGEDGLAWAARVQAELEATAEAEVLTRTTAFGYYDHNLVALLQRFGPDDAGMPRTRLWRVRAGIVVLATGALERPLVFGGNDRPGVMLAGAVRTYLARYAVCPGRRTLVYTNNDAAYATVGALQQAGATVAAVVDSRAEPSLRVLDTARGWGVEVIAGGSVRGTFGAPGLRQVGVRDGRGRRRVIPADALAMSGGWNPALHLFSQAGGKAVWDDASVAFVPGEAAQAVRCIGACAGRRALADVLAQAHAAGAAAGAEAGFGAAPPPPPRATGESGRPGPDGLEPMWRAPGRGKAFVDFQNDVTTGDLALAAREGFTSVEHVKRYTTLGMAPDQGKTSNVNALVVLGLMTGRAPGEVGTTSFRPPYTPVPLAAFAGMERGELFRPRRRLAAHAWHVAKGAVFEDYGWVRPAYYLRPGETPQAAEQREALAVRHSAGIFDGSPLGKIEVVGPDAGAFLDRIYANAISTLKVGRLRYGLMLNEQGVVIDDGVATRLAEDRFLVGTTSAGAERIAAWLEEWLQGEWPDLRVITAPLTAAWSVATVTGPAARAVLSAAATDIDLSPGGFPHMSWRAGKVAGLPARVSRVSFTGEISYEVAVATSDAPQLFERLDVAGSPLGLQPVGIDAWTLLRTEKGYLHVGADTDGTTLPQDVGWSRVLKRGGDFVGRRSLTLPEAQRPGRLQLVGLEAQASTAALPMGARLRAPGACGAGCGYVTSTGFSPVLGRGVALAMVQGGAARHGEVLEVDTGEVSTSVRITAPGGYDPSGARLNG